MCYIGICVYLCRRFSIQADTKKMISALSHSTSVSTDSVVLAAPLRSAALLP